MTGRTRSLWVSKGTDKEGHLVCPDTDSESQPMCAQTPTRRGTFCVFCSVIAFAFRNQSYVCFENDSMS